jgi:PAS domain S-box-containing protein
MEDDESSGRPETSLLSEGLFREIYHSVNDAIFVHDAETGDILDVNDTMCEMYGYTRSEARQLTIEDLSSGTPPYTQADAVEKIREAAGGEPQVFDWYAERKDGTRFWVEVSMRHATVDGRPLILVIVRDVTDRKERERRLQRQNARLEEFASVVSHDLRSPLQVAAGRLDLAREECETEHHDVIERAHERMERIIDDVLWLAQEGQEIGSTTPVPLDEVIQRAWTIVADRADTAELTYADGRDALPVVVADRDRLRQLVENLFRNALDHAGPEVTVTVGVLEGGFYVADDGPGIPADEREDVFDAGYSTTEDGTGFGLHIVEQVAEAHGWTVRVADGSEGGTRFEFTGVEFAD